MKYLLLFLLVCLGCGTAAAQHRILGADLSMLPAYEEAGAVFKDAGGQAQADPLLFFRDEAGIRCVRVRLFVNPSKETGVIQDLDFVNPFGRRIKEAGMKLMLDFHYSDTWADPGKQYIPRSWPTTAEGIKTKLYAYTTDCLQTLNEAGVSPDYIQVGNEISFGMCSMTASYANGKWTKTATPFGVNAYNDTNWNVFLDFLKAGCKACREQCPSAKIIIHTEQAGNTETTRRYYQRLTALDYDIIGLSYYPFWHKSLSVLGQTLDNLADVFPTKEVMIVETAYNNAWYPTGDGIYDFQSLWPASPAGQQKFVEDLIVELLRHTNVTGLFYWMPEENPAGNRVYEPWLNRGLFANGYASVGQGNANCALPAFFSLKKFTEGQDDAIRSTKEDKAALPQQLYDLSGRPVAPSYHGLAVTKNRKFLIPIPKL